MKDVRAVPIDALQADLIEEIGLELLRNGDRDRGTQLLRVYRDWKVSRAVLDDIPAFRCNVDESAGMAEDHLSPGRVVELRSYSRKAPCA